MVLRGQFYNRNREHVDGDANGRCWKLSHNDLMSPGNKICYAINNVDEC